MDRLRHLLVRQSGVVSRRQAASCGVHDHDLRRLVRRRELARVHPGVFVDHTGSPTWLQRAWAAVLHVEPAALAGESALRAAGLPGWQSSTGVVVAVAAERRVNAPDGARLVRVRSLEPRVQWNASPPRLRVEEALVDVAAHAARGLDAFAHLVDAVRSRHTTAARLGQVVEARQRLPRRRLLLDAVAALQGHESVLERAWTVQVERPHRLPRGTRQAHVLPGARHDVLYDAQQVVVELDGRDFHSLTRDRHADLARDTAVLAAGHVTVRLGWSHVVATPCRTAALVADLLAQRGWRGQPRRCPDC